MPLDWFLHRPCPLCRRSARAAGGAPSPCPACLEQLALAPGGLHAPHPLSWWAAGTYAGALRQRILHLRRRPDPAAAAALVAAMRPVLPTGNSRPLLVPIPSWKRQANPLPPLLTGVWSRRLGLRGADLLERGHPVLGQHHLGRDLRFRNQEGAFRCRRGPRGDERRRRPLLLVDDILTTGATALSGAGCLEAAGWRVLGILCLARTP